MEVLPDSTLEVLQHAALTEEQAKAKAIFEQGRDAVVFALLELSKQLAEARGPQATPSTPSGMIPVYEKPPAKSRKKQPGAKDGHPGSRRRVPDRIDRRETHKLPCCPDCGGRLKRTGDTRTRYVEDIPEIQPVVAEATMERIRIAILAMFAIHLFRRDGRFTLNVATGEAIDSDQQQIASIQEFERTFDHYPTYFQICEYLQDNLHLFNIDSDSQRFDAYFGGRTNSRGFFVLQVVIFMCTRG